MLLGCRWFCLARLPGVRVRAQESEVGPWAASQRTLPFSMRAQAWLLSQQGPGHAGLSSTEAHVSGRTRLRQEQAARGSWEKPGTNSVPWHLPDVPPSPQPRTAHCLLHPGPGEPSLFPLRAQPRTGTHPASHLHLGAPAQPQGILGAQCRRRRGHGYWVSAHSLPHQVY